MTENIYCIQKPQLWVLRILIISPEDIWKLKPCHYGNSNIFSDILMIIDRIVHKVEKPGRIKES